MKISEHIHAIKLPFQIPIGQGKIVERFVYVYLIYAGLTRLNFNFDIGRHFCIVYPTLANIRYAEADYL
jgi:hypothetical protein